LLLETYPSCRRRLNDFPYSRHHRVTCSWASESQESHKNGGKQVFSGNQRTCSFVSESPERRSTKHAFTLSSTTELSPPVYDAFTSTRNATLSYKNPELGLDTPRLLKATSSTMTVEICKPIRDDFADCVLRSNCVLREGRTVQDCIKNPQDLPEQCRHLMTSFSNCKRGLVSPGVSFSLALPLIFAVDLCIAGYEKTFQSDL
jgi:hypothetical protein